MEFPYRSHITVVDKFILDQRNFGRNFTCAPDQLPKQIGAQKQSASVMETQLETLLFYYLSLK